MQLGRIFPATAGHLLQPTPWTYSIALVRNRSRPTSVTAAAHIRDRTATRIRGCLATVTHIRDHRVAATHIRDRVPAATPQPTPAETDADRAVDTDLSVQDPPQQFPPSRAR
jgi:hypothetical protein